MKHIPLTAAFLLCFLLCDAQKFVDAYNSGNYKKSLSLAQKTIDKDSKNLDAYLICLLYTSDAADERSSVDLGGRRIIKKKTQSKNKR